MREPIYGRCEYCGNSLTQGHECASMYGKSENNNYNKIKTFIHAKECGKDYQMIECVTYTDHAAALRQAREGIKAVYEKYKHLDALFCDEQWLDDGRPQTRALYDMWQAIRAEAAKDSTTDPSANDKE